ncbi:MAG TPA: (d)CMP kinase [Aestuariivirgaceae bacterium]|nr:(d)CMP kinase [Aestuariivirgaceae bacterium]
MLQWLIERDRRDETRPVAPLRRAPDAHLLDTSDLDIEATFQAAVAIIDRHR